MFHDSRISPRKSKDDFRSKGDVWQQLGWAIGTLWRKIQDSRNRTKPRLAESAAEKFKKRKGKLFGAEHPTRVSMKPRPAKPTTQPEERKEERLDLPPTEPTPEIQEAPRSKPSWLRDTSDIRRAIIQAEILRRPHPRRIGKRRP